jgi:hypothetical protein
MIPSLDPGTREAHKAAGDFEEGIEMAKAKAKPTKKKLSPALKKAAAAKRKAA